MMIIVRDFIDSKKDYLLIVWKDGRVKRVSGHASLSAAWDAMLDDARLTALELEAEALEDKMKAYAQRLTEGSSAVIGLAANDAEVAEIYFTFIDENGVISEDRLSIDQIETATALKS